MLKRKKLIRLFIPVFYFFCSSLSWAEEPIHCRYSREYITTLEYLRSQKAFDIPEARAEKIAEKVSTGCIGSAKRFIKIAAILSESGITTSESIQMGIEFSEKTDFQMQTFIQVFLSAFLKENLDLDLKTSIQMAHSLSIEFPGNPQVIEKDFQTLVHFCISERYLNLSRPLCGPFAARIAQKGENFQGGIANPFIQIFSFLISDSGARLTTGQALPLAEHIIEGGQNSTENFIEAFKYGVSPKGLNHTVPQAIQFATIMASQNASKNAKPGT